MKTRLFFVTLFLGLGLCIGVWGEETTSWSTTKTSSQAKNPSIKRLQKAPKKNGSSAVPLQVLGNTAPHAATESTPVGAEMVPMERFPSVDIPEIAQTITFSTGSPLESSCPAPAVIENRPMRIFSFGLTEMSLFEGCAEKGASTEESAIEHSEEIAPSESTSVFLSQYEESDAKASTAHIQVSFLDDFELTAPQNGVDSAEATPQAPKLSETTRETTVEMTRETTRETAVEESTLEILLPDLPESESTADAPQLPQILSISTPHEEVFEEISSIPLPEVAEFTPLDGMVAEISDPDSQENSSENEPASHEGISNETVKTPLAEEPKAEEPKVEELEAEEPETEAAEEIAKSTESVEKTDVDLDALVQKVAAQVAAQVTEQISQGVLDAVVTQATEQIIERIDTEIEARKVEITLPQPAPSSEKETDVADPEPSKEPKSSAQPAVELAAESKLEPEKAEEKVEEKVEEKTEEKVEENLPELAALPEIVEDLSSLEYNEEKPKAETTATPAAGFVKISGRKTTAAKPNAPSQKVETASASLPVSKSDAGFVRIGNRKKNPAPAPVVPAIEVKEEKTVSTPTSVPEATPVPAPTPAPEAKAVTPSVSATPEPPAAPAQPEIRRVTLTPCAGVVLRTDAPIQHVEIENRTFCDVVEFSPNQISLIGKIHGSTPVRVTFTDEKVAPMQILVTVSGGDKNTHLLSDWCSLMENAFQQNTEMPLSLSVFFFQNRIFVKGDVPAKEYSDVVFRLVQNHFLQLKKEYPDLQLPHREGEAEEKLIMVNLMVVKPL